MFPAADGMTGVIPQADPARRLGRFRSEIDQALKRVFDSGRLLLGPETAAFEQEFAAYLGGGEVVAVASGASALTIALTALGIEPGDEVVVPALTAVPTAGAIHRAGALPVFADVDPLTRNLDPAALGAAIGPHTRAIVPVHLHGMPADMPAILAVARRHGLAVIEDCAQAHGASLGGRMLGTFGHAAAFSFYPTKNLGAAGDAGAIFTADGALAARARRLRAHGLDDHGVAAETGETGRIDEMQAAILRVLLPHLDAANADRRRIAGEYSAALAGSGIDLPPEFPTANYHQFAVALDRRDDVRARMAQAGILTGIHYPRALHQHPAFKSAASLPVAERLATRLLSLPIQPEVAETRAAQIAAVLLQSLRS